MKKEKLKTIDFIEIKSFRHKIQLTKKNKECKMEVLDKYLYIERCRDE